MEYMERIMKEGNDRDHIELVDAVEGPVVCVCIEEALQTLNKYKKSSWTFRCINRVDCCQQVSKNIGCDRESYME